LRQGVDVVRGHDVALLRDMTAAQVMNREPPRLQQSATLPEIIQRVMETDYPHFVVEDEQGRLVGVLSAGDLAPCLGYAGDLEQVVLAYDIMTKDVVTVTEQTNLARALELMEARQVGSLPVTPAFEPWRVAGQLKKDDLLHVYRERLAKSRLLSRRR
jgi:CIC family chloride channel protein